MSNGRIEWEKGFMIGENEGNNYDKKE